MRADYFLKPFFKQNENTQTFIKKDNENNSSVCPEISAVVQKKKNIARRKSSIKYCNDYQLFVHFAKSFVMHCVYVCFFNCSGLANHLYKVSNVLNVNVTANI